MIFLGRFVLANAACGATTKETRPRTSYFPKGPIQIRREGAVLVFMVESLNLRTNGV